jgi:SAM-dependent methyltransferase
MLDLDALDDARLFAQPETGAGHETPFYHAMHVPGLGDVGGDWDLRADLGTYLGRVDYKDAVVLDIGASDGFLAFEIEKRGATVVTVDLPRDVWPDLFPLAPPLSAEAQARFLERLAAMRAAFWFCHRAFASRVRLHESHANRLDRRLTGFDVAVMGNVLQHLRDPAGVLLDLATRANTIVITEADWLLGSLDAVPTMTLFTSHIARGNPASWFMVSPKLVEDLLSLAGFSIVARDIHHQLYADPILQRTTPVRHYTITATRTAPAAAAASPSAPLPG